MRFIDVPFGETAGFDTVDSAKAYKHSQVNNSLIARLALQPTQIVRECGGCIGDERTLLQSATRERLPAAPRLA
ncbi:adenylosuccinate synthetase [Erythrobacter sp. NAP1]|uniref:hypothetical protein n=1 Tax=Erythrobacter sp. NAP1 TaxID=237727 RepID=UPI0000686F83|nr:hypothetical protein [Erythrobacter sp. NAP1]EAQ29354.1 adenylosuccinate synthetase [Erythrobacter sp. NAP1]